MTDESRQQIVEHLALRDKMLHDLAPENTSAYVLTSTIRVIRQKNEHWRESGVIMPEIAEPFSYFNEFTPAQKQELHAELVEVYDEMAALLEG